MSTTITFQTPYLQKFEGKLLTISDNIIRVSFKYSIFRWLWTEELFAIADATFPTLPLENLESDTPVELELRLTNLHLQRLSESLEAELPKNPNLQSTESWMAHTIFQEADLSEMQQGVVEGSLKIGYKSIWHQHSSQEVNMPELAKFYFLKNQIPYEEVSPTLFRVQMEEENVNWIFLVKLDVDNQFCMCYSVFPAKVPENLRSEMASFLIDQNYDIGVGNFEMDTSDGEIRYRTSIDAEGDTLSDANFNQLISLNVGTFLRFYEEIQGKF